MEATQLKMRASALGNIIGFDSSTQVTDKQIEMIAELELKKVTPVGLTENQQKELDKLNAIKESDKDLSEPQRKKLVELIAKRDTPPSLTENQQTMLDSLIAKRDAPPALSKGAKTAVETIFTEEKFSFRKQISSKYIQKGHKMEDKAIEIIADYFGIKGIEKNETHYTNEFVQGTPDAIVRLGFGEGFQFDIKNVYYPDRLDGFTDKLDSIYEWQGHAYNWMLGFDHGFVVKILQNLPIELIDLEIKNLWKEAGRSWTEEIPQSFRDDVTEYFNFESRLPLEDRIKIFKIETTKEHIEQMTDAVKLARDHYATLQPSWNNRNAANVDFIKSLLNG